MKIHPILFVSAVLMSAGNQFAAEQGGVSLQVQPGGIPLVARS